MTQIWITGALKACFRTLGWTPESSREVAFLQDEREILSEFERHPEVSSSDYSDSEVEDGDTMAEHLLLLEMCADVGVEEMIDEINEGIEDEIDEARDQVDAVSSAANRMMSWEKQNWEENKFITVSNSVIVDCFIEAVNDLEIEYNGDIQSALRTGQTNSRMVYEFLEQCTIACRLNNYGYTTRAHLDAQSLLCT